MPKGRAHLLLFAVLPIFVYARPNVVLIIADDLGWSDVGFHSDNIRTPNLDALAYNGVIIKRHYAQPLCTPSRSALLTGDYPIRHGMQGTPCIAGVTDGLPIDLKLLPQHLSELGYRSHLVGKWHLGFETEHHLPTRRGYDTFFGYLNGYLSYWDGTHEYQDRPGRDFWRNETGIWREVYGKYLTETLTKEAVRLIHEHDPEENLFLVLSENAVHTTPLPMGREAPPTVRNNTKRGILRDMVMWMDWSVGEVISALNNKGILKNTVVIFLSDNGAPTSDATFENYSSNWPFRGQKSSPHEGGVRTASLLYSPILDNVPRVTDQMFHITDWFSTIISIAGGKVDELENKDGMDQWPSLVNATAGPRDELLVDIDEVSAREAYISGRWKLIKNSNPSDQKSSISDKYHVLDEDWMTYDIEEVRNSKVGRILGTVPDNWSELRRAAAVEWSCGDTEAAEKLDCHNKYCLFDLLEDPSECYDRSADNSSVVEQLATKLEAYRDVLMPQIPKVYDHRADPSRFQDYWSPWLQDPLSQTNF